MLHESFWKGSMFGKGTCSTNKPADTFNFQLLSKSFPTHSLIQNCIRTSQSQIRAFDLTDNAAISPKQSVFTRRRCLPCSWGDSNSVIRRMEVSVDSLFWPWWKCQVVALKRTVWPCSGFISTATCPNFKTPTVTQSQTFKIHPFLVEVHPM